MSGFICSGDGRGRQRVEEMNIIKSIQKVCSRLFAEYFLKDMVILSYPLFAFWGFRYAQSAAV